jgi:hypothetical protein
VGCSRPCPCTSSRTAGCSTAGDGLYLRSLDSAESRDVPLDGYPSGIAWAPDGEALAYWDGRSIFRVPARGGAPVRLFLEPDDDAERFRLAWLDDGRIVFARHSSDDGLEVHAIPAGGGAPTPVVAFEGPPLTSTVTDITAIPGGRFVAVLFEIDQGKDRQVLVGVDASGTRTLLELDGLRSTCWVPGGRLLLQTERASEAQTWVVRLSTETLEVQGEPRLLEEPLGGASVSADGTLAYVESNARPTSRLAWWSPDGTLEPVGREHDSITAATYSPRRDAIVYDTGRTLNPRDGALFRLDLRRDVTTELSTGDLWVALGMTLGDGRIAVLAVEFEPDGERWSTFLLPDTGRGTPELWQQGFVEDVTDDLRRALVSEPVPALQDALETYVLDLASGERSRILRGRAELRLADISPDGHWLVYFGARSGPAYLTRFPSGDDERQVSGGGVQDVAFSPDGSRIYYTTEEELYAVELTMEPEVEPGTEPRVELGVPELVGAASAGVQLTPQRDADSERFLAIESSAPYKSELVIVQDWASRLEER